MKISTGFAISLKDHEAYTFGYSTECGTFTILWKFISETFSKISGVVHILVFVHELKFTVACPKDFSCLNEGTCIDGSCSCANGFVGYSCEQGKAIETHLIINIYYTYVSTWSF